jgi:glycosyltransferase involved in cell wall biosynthesis
MILSKGKLRSGRQQSRDHLYGSWYLRMSVEPPENLQAGLVSVGMPVYNSARFLRGALDALLAQDYGNFEISISDNASEDETEAICREYVQRDPRIRYFRTDKNRGGLWNFARVYELARGEYFMWAAHDDIRHPQYLSRCVAALEQNPRAIFCSTGVKFIDVDGLDVTESFSATTLRPVGATPLERLRALARSTYWVDPYSLFRTGRLTETGLIQEGWGGDVLFVAAACLRGEVVEVPERLFSYRLFFDKSAEAVARSMEIPVSWLHLTLGMLKNIWRAPLGVLEKARMTSMFVNEFCVRNMTVRGYIEEERFRGARHMFIHRHFLRALGMTALGVILFAPAYFRRVWAFATSWFRETPVLTPGEPKP